MAIFRVDKNRGYTVMANHHLRNERLSLKSKGLLSVILSLPDDWRISIEGMTQFSSDGKDAIRSAIRELTDAGYITRDQTHSEAGTFSGYEYIIHETPSCENCTTASEKSPVKEDLPSCGNRTTADASPSSGNPTTENPTTENPTLRNTEQLSTILPPIVPHEEDGGDGTTPDNPSVSLAADTSAPLSAACGGISPRRGESSPCTGEAQSGDPPPKRKRRAAKPAPDYKPDIFARFWAAYPRGEDKQGAIAAWDELRPDDATLHAMSRALVRQKASEEWRRGIGIPYAVRWLRRRRWEDEIKATAPPPEERGGDLPVWI